MRARNYAIADKFKPKIYIPVIGIEIYGRFTLFLIILMNLVIVAVLGTLLSFFIGSKGYYFAIFITFAITVISFGYIKQKNKDSGTNKLQEFYYQRIKKYNIIYDSSGNKKFINSELKGVYYIYVR